MHFSMKNEMLSIYLSIVKKYIYIYIIYIYIYIGQWVGAVEYTDCRGVKTTHERDSRI